MDPGGQEGLSKDPKRIRPKAISGANLYTAYTAKFLQASPGAIAPKSAPVGRFVSPGGSYDLDTDPSTIIVDANLATPTGMTVEILTQRLDAAYRKPTKAYVHAAFHVFPTTASTFEVSVPAGAYRVAVQYVETATGRTAAFQVVGTATVLEMVEGGLSDAGESRRAA